MGPIEEAIEKRCFMIRVAETIHIVNAVASLGGTLAAPVTKGATLVLPIAAGAYALADIALDLSEHIGEELWKLRKAHLGRQETETELLGGAQPELGLSGTTLDLPI